MQVGFSDLQRDIYGKPLCPSLVLKKPHGEIIGTLGYAFGLQFELKFNDISTGTFQYPKRVHGVKTPLYGTLVRGKLVQIDPIGVFVASEVNEIIDGASKIKEVTLSSYEYELTGKSVVFAAGTYNLWNIADQENTLLGMVLENAPNWKIGYVSSTLIGRYRTFDDIDSKVYDFLQGTVQDSYGCIIIYDTYNCTINIYDVDEEVGKIPIYLSYANLLKQGDIKELDESLPTKLLVRGADGVDIRDVNPTGDNYIYNLDYYIENGDLPDTLATKWLTWQNTIFARQPYYTSLVALRNTTIGSLTVETARLSDYKNELVTLDNTRATFLQMQMTVESGGETWQYFQERLAETATEYSAIESKIASQQSILDGIQSELAEYQGNIADVNAELKMNSYFTEEELSVLNHYFKEDSFVDNTFATFDVDVSDDNRFQDVDNATLQFLDVTWTDVPCDGGHHMAAISGGSFVVTGTNYALGANIASGTLDHKGGQVVCSLFLGAGELNGVSFPSGNFTVVCSSDYDDDNLLSTMQQCADTKTSADGFVSHTIYYYTGDTSISVIDGAFYFTRNTTEYQKYSVAQELYDYATEQHKDIARPIYEFEIESGNIVYEQKFAPFKNALKLGCSCYLQLDSDLLLTPVLIEIHIDFDDPENFSLIFANQFRRPDNVNSLKDAVADAFSSSKDFDNSKLAYGQNNNTTTWVKNMIQNGFDAALAQIQAGKDNLVTIDAAGVKIDSADGIDKIYLNNGMIALVDKRTNTAKMAMGHFLNPATGTDFVGVLADIIGGTLLAGQNLIIECPDPNGGVMQFKVDSSGVILNNGRMYMRTDKGAMGWDANYGFFAGTSSLFQTTDTGYVHPTCIDSSGNMIFDSTGFPQDVNVWVGIDGQVYIRGKIYATEGRFNGIVQASDFLDSSGKSMLTNAGKFSADYLELKGLNINNNFIVDSDGRVTINNGSISWGSVTGTEEIDSRINNAQSIAKKIANGTYSGGTFINGKEIYSPTIYANTLEVLPETDTSSTGGLNIYGYTSTFDDLYHMLQIKYSWSSTAPYVTFSSPDGAYLQFGNNKSYMLFNGTASFSNCDVSGLYLTFS